MVCLSLCSCCLSWISSFFAYSSFAFLCRFIPRHFIPFVPVVNGTVSLISLSDLSLLVYRNTRDFCVFCIVQLDYTSLISSSNFLVAYLGFSMYSIIEKAREFQKNIYFCFIDYAKAFDCVDHNKRWKILGDWNTRPPICLLRSLYAGQEATVRTGHGTTDWFQIGKGIHQGCILSPCLFNLYAEYIMRNAGLEEAQAGIKTAGRNISNLRYADVTTLMAQSEEELKSLLMK